MMSKDQQSLKSTTKLLSKMSCDRLCAKLARLNCPAIIFSGQVQAKYRVVENWSNSGKELQVMEVLEELDLLEVLGVLEVMEVLREMRWGMRRRGSIL